MNQRAVLGICIVPGRCFIRDTWPSDNLTDLDAISSGKPKIAAVMSRYTHDGTCTIAHENIVGNPDRDLLTGEQVDRVGSREDTRLLPVRRHAVDLRLGLAGSDICIDLGMLLARNDLLDPVSYTHLRAHETR